MAYRVINSVLVLRDQVNALAPGRSKASDGTICDTNHPTTSDHCPHNVPGVGAEMVTALDLTHDPAGGFDSFLFAEVLRVNRDARIKYVISNSRIFASYATSSRAAWTWGPYADADKDPHTNHVHVSVLDATISDTSTAWNLEGFTVSINDVIVGESQLWDKAANRVDATGRNFANDVYKVISDSLGDEFASTDAKIAAVGQAVAVGFAQMAGALSQLQSKLDAIEAKLNATGGTTFPSSSTFTTTGTVTWNPIKAS